MATDAVEIDLPASASDVAVATTANRVNLAADGRLAWNGTAIGAPQLVALLARSKSLPITPELGFESEVDAPKGLFTQVAMVESTTDEAGGPREATRPRARRYLTAMSLALAP